VNGAANTPSLFSRASGLMIVRSVAQLRLLFERLWFELEKWWTSEDSTGRAFLWATLFFGRSAEAPQAARPNRAFP